jgi:hypothetical protein
MQWDKRKHYQERLLWTWSIEALRLKVPGIDADKIQLNATEDFIEISGEQSEEEG